MNPFRFWYAPMALSMEAARVTMAANTVIAHRLYGNSFIQPLEAWRMAAEKPLAFAQASIAGWRAATAGQDSVAVSRAALRPLRMRVERNARRLGR